MFLQQRLGCVRGGAPAFSCAERRISRQGAGVVVMAGEKSHSSVSAMYRSMGTLLQPYLEESLLHHFAPPEGTAPIHYADFGCGTGATTLAYATFVAETLKKRFGTRDVVCHFADLPSNDFNSLFNQLPPIAGDEEGGVEARTWFAAGVPGSQYESMFPRSSLHVVITTLSLHFLPEIPASLADKASPAYNRGHIGVHGASPAAASAFAEASQKGLRMFFDCRAEEMAPGGVLAFFCTGRRDRAHPEIQYPDNTMIFTLHLENALRELVNEGVIPEELLDSYNVPACSPSVDDIREAVEHPTSEFHIHNVEYIPDFRPLPENAGETMFKDATSFATTLTNMIQGAMSTTITAHFGAEPSDAVYQRLRQNFEKQYQQWKDDRFFRPVPLCLAVLLRK